MHNLAPNSTKAFDKIRQFILDEVKKADRSLSLKTLSLAAGKNPAYIHQFIYRGSPRFLPEDVRHKLAAELGVSEHALRTTSDPQSDAAATPLHSTANVLISYIDHPSQQHHADGPWFVPKSFLEQLTHTSPRYIRLGMVGDSTADFGIAAGDVIMMDTKDHDTLAAGYFALNAGGHIRVRHLEQATPFDDRIIVSGNNNAAYTFKKEDAEIMGRVIFHAQMFSALSPSRKHAAQHQNLGSAS